MISYLQGTVKRKSDVSLLVLVRDVGYSVVVPKPLLESSDIDESVELYIKSYVRDDHIALYGFGSEDVLKMFELLTGVSGVGPKMALNVFDIHSPQDVHKAVFDDRVEAFTAVTGIGKKNASRIILELKSKLGQEISLSALTGKGGGSELVEALEALGYSAKEIEKMVQGIPWDIDLDAQLKQALQKR